ncbi:MAG: phosphatidate cytidylyltransferase [Kangiellaceae bacterium]
MLKQRVITALLLLPLLAFILFYVRIEYFTAIILVLVYFMAQEWSKLCAHPSSAYHSLYAVLVASCCLSIWYFSESLVFWPSPSWPHIVSISMSDLPLLILFLSVVSLLISFVIVITFSKNNNWWRVTAFREILGILLLTAFFVSFICMRQTDYPLMGDGNFAYGGSLILFMFLIIWAADVGAYFVGKQFGKTKLTKVSPNKTWEGVIGGLALSFIIGWLGIDYLSLNVDNKFTYLTVITLLGVISVYGDLFESALKRTANVKDSGNILPGHGGLLDRLDSTIAVAPIYFLSFSYFEWFNV